MYDWPKCRVCRYTIPAVTRPGAPLTVYCSERCQRIGRRILRIQQSARNRARRAERMGNRPMGETPATVQAPRDGGRTAAEVRTALPAAGLDSRQPSPRARAAQMATPRASGKGALSTNKGDAR